MKVEKVVVSKLIKPVIQPKKSILRSRALSPADLFGRMAPAGALIGLLERVC